MKKNNIFSSCKKRKEFAFLVAVAHGVHANEPVSIVKTQNPDAFSFTHSHGIAM
jgi:hypothetical protein